MTVIVHLMNYQRTDFRKESEKYKRKLWEKSNLIDVASIRSLIGDYEKTGTV